MTREEDMAQLVHRFNEANALTTKDTDVPNWYDEKGKFKHYVLGRYMLEHCHIKRIDGELYIYNKDKRYICYRRYQY